MVELKGSTIVQGELCMTINLMFVSNSKIITSLLRCQLCYGISDCRQTSEGTLT